MAPYHEELGPRLIVDTQRSKDTHTRTSVRIHGRGYCFFSGEPPNVVAESNHVVRGMNPPLPSSYPASSITEYYSALTACMWLMHQSTRLPSSSFAIRATGRVEASLPVSASCRRGDHNILPRSHTDISQHPAGRAPKRTHRAYMSHAAQRDCVLADTAARDLRQAWQTRSDVDSPKKKAALHIRNKDKAQSVHGFC